MSSQSGSATDKTFHNIVIANPLLLKSSEPTSLTASNNCLAPDLWSVSRDCLHDVYATHSLTIYVILLDLSHPSGSNWNCVIQQGSTGGVEERADVEYGRRCLPLAADSAALCTRFTPISAFRTSQSTVSVNHTVSALKNKRFSEVSHK